jgi:catechol 2,3-dioxygenase-like lactoylglutathione lyase family enzyme
MKADYVRDIDDIDMKLEVAVIPVTDVERAKDFYGRLGWRLDQTPPGVVQYTPHGSGCSVQFGSALTAAEPGSAKEYLIVSDLEQARESLLAAGVEVEDIFHITADGPEAGVDPQRRSYFSQASFSDPDGNTWLLQEITHRLPGRVEADETSFGTANDLASALRRAAAAYSEHEKRAPGTDPAWPEWFAAYMVSEQAGLTPPQ